jgi:hypothetical protein
MTNSRGVHKSENVKGLIIYQHELRCRIKICAIINKVVDCIVTLDVLLH